MAINHQASLQNVQAPNIQLEFSSGLGIFLNMSSVAEITEAIDHLDAREQVRLLNELPGHLKIKPEDLAWLRASEKSFEF
jgi:hypothetical protein